MVVVCADGKMQVRAGRRQRQAGACGLRAASLRPGFRCPEPLGLAPGSTGGRHGRGRAHRLSGDEEGKCRCCCLRRPVAAAASCCRRARACSIQASPSSRASVLQLLERPTEYAARGVVRSDKSAAQLRGYGATEEQLIVGDILREGGQGVLQKAMAGADALVGCRRRRGVSGHGRGCGRVVWWRSRRAHSSLVFSPLPCHPSLCLVLRSSPRKHAPRPCVGMQGNVRRAIARGTGAREARRPAQQADAQHAHPHHQPAGRQCPRSSRCRSSLSCWPSCSRRRGCARSSRSRKTRWAAEGGWGRADGAAAAVS